MPIENESFILNSLYSEGIVFDINRKQNLKDRYSIQDSHTIWIEILISTMNARNKVYWNITIDEDKSV